MDANVTFSTAYVLERLEEEVVPRAGLLLDPKGEQIFMSFFLISATYFLVTVTIPKETHKGFLGFLFVRERLSGSVTICLFISLVSDLMNDLSNATEFARFRVCMSELSPLEVGQLAGKSVRKFLSCGLAFQLAYSYNPCTDASWPASSYDADAVNVKFTITTGDIKPLQGEFVVNYDVSQREFIMDYDVSQGEFVMDYDVSEGEFVVDHDVSKGEFVMDYDVSQGEFVMDYDVSQGELFMDYDLSQGEFVMDYDVWYQCNK
uniref:Late blight resistance protein n=1 Tax=Solanum tuberosum TaxID=4113 RepID=M1D015_SOLTU